MQVIDRVRLPGPEAERLVQTSRESQDADTANSINDSQLGMACSCPGNVDYRSSREGSLRICCTELRVGRDFTEAPRRRFRVGSKIPQIYGLAIGTNGGKSALLRPCNASSLVSFVIGPFGEKKERETYWLHPRMRCSLTRI